MLLSCFVVVIVIVKINLLFVWWGFFVYVYCVDDLTRWMRGWFSIWQIENHIWCWCEISGVQILWKTSLTDSLRLWLVWKSRGKRWKFHELQPCWLAVYYEKLSQSFPLKLVNAYTLVRTKSKAVIQRKSLQEGTLLTFSISYHMNTLHERSKFIRVFWRK